MGYISRSDSAETFLERNNRQMQYVDIPRQLSSNEILDADFCYSPGRYVRFIPPKIKSKTHFASLDELVELRSEKAEIAKGQSYSYAEIGDINVFTGDIIFRPDEGLGINLLIDQQ